MYKVLTPKQEKYTLGLFKGKAQIVAYLEAGYSPKSSVKTREANASRLASNERVLMRLAELRKKAEDAAIMDKQEILKRHSDIARGNITDFVGKGNRIEITDETPHKPAIQEYNTFEVTIGKGENAKLAEVTKVKLHDPVRSMQEICKLLGFYPKEGTGEGVNIGSLSIDNRSVNIGEGADAKDKLIAELNRFASRKQANRDDPEAK